MKYKSELKHGFINPEAVARRSLAFKEVFLKISQNSQENTCTRVSFFLIKLKTLWHRCFLVNFAKFLRPLFFIEHLPWLLLLIVSICTAVLQALHAFQIKRDLKSRDMQFFLQDVPNEIFKIFKYLKTTWNPSEQPAELNQK